MSDTPRAVRVFVNAHGVDVPAGSSALDAVRAWNADEASAVSRGERVITDSRGLPIVTAKLGTDAGLIGAAAAGRVHVASRGDEPHPDPDDVLATLDQDRGRDG